MPAHSKTFPWESYCGHYRYFEGKMNRHDKVRSLTQRDFGVYDLARMRGDVLRVFICECYAFGVAEFMQTFEQLGNIDAVIINSAWCGYAPNAKQHCRDQCVGLFSIGEFMAALHWDDFWNYLTDAEQEYFKNQGWL